MNFLRRHYLIIGSFILACVILVLLSDPSLVFSHGVTFIDTDLHRSSGDEAYVRTKMDFGSQEHMSAFPTQIGEWKGYDYDTSKDRESLGADIILLRSYSSPGFYQPIFFLIMQAKTESSFHPPNICYVSQGFKIQEEAKEKISITSTGWAEASQTILVPLNKIVVFKESQGQVTERRVALYCYIKGNQFTSDTITMIRIEALTPMDGSYEGILNLEKDFLAQTIPYMFEPAKGTQWNPLVLQITQVGVVGYIAITLLLIIPLLIIVYLRTRWGRSSIEGSETDK